MNQKVQQAKEGLWAFLNSKAGIGIICALLAGGGTRLFPLLGLGGGAGEGMNMGTPLACTRAMQDMREAMVSLRVTVEEQGKRMDRFETKIDRLNDRLDYRAVARGAK